MHIQEYIDKIVSKGSPEDMKQLSDILKSAIYKIKDYDEKCYKKFKTDLYELANGKVITMEMAEDWVNSMNPAAKWDFSSTSAVKNQYGITDIDDISFYIVMNMLYSDMSDVFGSGDNNESINHYVKGTKDWLGDIDVSQNKLYNYKKYVVG